MSLRELKAINTIVDKYVSINTSALRDLNILFRSIIPESDTVKMAEFSAIMRKLDFDISTTKHQVPNDLDSMLYAAPRRRRIDNTISKAMRDVTPKMEKIINSKGSHEAEGFTKMIFKKIIPQQQIQQQIPQQIVDPDNLLPNKNTIRKCMIKI